MVQALYTTRNIVDTSSDTVHCTLTCGMSNRNQMGRTMKSLCSEMGCLFEVDDVPNGARILLKPTRQWAHELFQSQ